VRIGNVNFLERDGKMTVVTVILDSSKDYWEGNTSKIKDVMVFKVEGYESEDEILTSINKQLPEKTYIREYWTSELKSLGI
jgi:hypothetical protein